MNLSHLVTCWQEQFLLPLSITSSHYTKDWQEQFILPLSNTSSLYTTEYASVERGDLAHPNFHMAF